MWRVVLRLLWTAVFRTWRRNFARATSTATTVTLLREVIYGRPETVFRGSMEPGTAIEIRVLDPGER